VHKQKTLTQVSVVTGDAIKVQWDL